MSEVFTSKWGIRTDDVETNEIAPLIVGQFVTTLVLLCIAQPTFLLTKRDAMRVSEFSWFRAILLALIIVSVTYCHPHFW